MAVSDWLRPPRHLVVLFLGIALILVATLTWLGWQLFRQDRALKQQRVQVRLEHTADVLAAELGARFGAIEDRVAALAAVPIAELPDSAERYVQRFCDDAAVLVLTEEGLAVYPSGRIPYYPVTNPLPEPDARAFARGEALEFRVRDLVGAASAYRRMAESSDATIRAGALLRLARVERKAGRVDAALQAYDSLAMLGSVAVNGLPAELVARQARLSSLDRLRREDELKRQAAALVRDLNAGRWHVTRAQYQFNADAACDWIDCTLVADSTTIVAKQALAAAAEWIWDRRATLKRAGRELLRLEEQPVLAVWHHTPERTVTLIGGTTHLGEDWLAAVQPTLQDQRVSVAFADVVGNLLTPPAASGQELLVTRTVADTRLPWTLHVASADPLGDFSQLAERRRLMLLGLATLAVFVAVGLYGVLRGVTRELEVARLQADFVAAVSHEFRTPLTSLRQLAELLASGRVTSDERRARYYGILERESGRLHRLVEGLLDFGRMEAGAMEFNWERVNPSHLVGNVVTEFQIEQGEHGRRIEFAADPAAPDVRADPEALGRAVWNLLDNAVKYSPDGERVWVDVSHADGRVAIAVRDEGVGIPADERRVIFTKFVRGTSSDGPGVKGTGIGLAMVQHIVKAHEGDVRVESDVGRGSTFVILLPVEE
jgi:signal transduction histidine kinase